jgi:hypothetical protein
VQLPKQNLLCAFTIAQAFTRSIFSSASSFQSRALSLEEFQAFPSASLALSNASLACAKVKSAISPAALHFDSSKLYMAAAAAAASTEQKFLRKI